MHLDAPEPSRYNLEKVYPKIAHRYCLSAPDSRNIKYTMRTRGVSMVEAIQNVGKRLPAPTDYDVAVTPKGERLGLDHRPSTFPMAERMKNPCLHSLPRISQGHDSEYQGKHSPGPVYDHPIGTINYTNVLAKGHRWASGKRFPEPCEAPKARLKDKTTKRLCKSDDFTQRSRKPFVPTPGFQSPPRGAKKVRVASEHLKSQLRRSAAIYSFTVKDDAS
eukprot:7195086-Pyramimonas_sp.AAC.1